MFVPDALSRVPVHSAVKEIELNDKAEVYSVVSQLPITREKLIEFQTATANDPTLQQVININIYDKRTSIFISTQII